MATKQKIEVGDKVRYKDDALTMATVIGIHDGVAWVNVQGNGNRPYYDEDFRDEWNLSELEIATPEIELTLELDIEKVKAFIDMSHRSATIAYIANALEDALEGLSE